MTDNLALWEKLGKTDPAHTKGFKRGGGFTGTAIKPMWSYKRMTEEFGPCGTGWGIGEPTFQVVNGDNREILVYCTASIWYGEDRKTVYGVGGDKIVTHIKANSQYNRPERWENDDEAFKKAFTDAITNALKLIGVGADVHMGLFDDSKYVNTLKQEFSEEKPEAAPANDAPKKADARPTYALLEKDMRLNKSKADLQRWIKDPDVKALRAKLTPDWDKNLLQAAADYGRDLPEETPAEDVFPGDVSQDIRDQLARHPLAAG